MSSPNVDGLDLSHWNVVIDEDAIPHYPLMSCKATEGRTAVSSKFAYFWGLFARHDARYRGAYHWVRSDSSMKSQVDHLANTLNKVGGLQVGDFIQLDWETTAGIPNMSVAQIEEWVGLAQSRWGDRVIVYGSDWVPNFLAWRKANPTIPVWYANYNTGDAATGGWAESKKYKATVWQWTSTYKCPGFLWNPSNPDDGVDANHVFDWATLDRLCLLEPLPPLPPEPPTEPSVEEEDSMRIKTPGQWFEKVGVDLRAVANGAEYAGLPGNEVTLTIAEMEQLLATCRYTYGDAKAEMGGSFVSTWIEKRQPAPSSGGPGAPSDPVSYVVTMTGTAIPGV